MIQHTQLANPGTQWKGQLKEGFFSAIFYSRSIKKETTGNAYLEIYGRDASGEPD